MLKASEAQGGRGTANAAGALLPIVAEHLTFEAAGRRLVDDVTLKLERGVKTVVMGPNGAGKSLLVRLLHGLIAPTSGSITWGGARPSEAARGRQAMVFQRPTLLRRSVKDNIRFVLPTLPESEAADRTEAALKRARLTELRDAPARLLSGGEQQRLAMARALAMDPAVLILDEPSSNLDPASQAEVESMIEAAHAEGTKIILVTHDAHQARRLADEIVFMSAGRVVEHAPARAFFAAPSSEPARAYLGGRLLPV